MSESTITAPDPLAAAVAKLTASVESIASRQRLLVDVVEAAAMFSVGRTTFLGWVGSIKGFPQPCEVVGFSGSRWRVAELETWVSKLKPRRTKRLEIE